jgi:hypothetical protein
MLDRTFYEWMVGLSENHAFQDAVLLSQRKEDEGFRHELVLRFLLHMSYSQGDGELKKEHGEYLTDWVRAAVTDESFDRAEAGSRFRGTFELLNRALDDAPFRRWDDAQGRFLGPFSISVYEAITSGIAANLDYWQQRPEPELADRIKQMWSSEYFRENSGTGVSPRRRMPRLVRFGREYFAPV